MPGSGSQECVLSDGTFAPKLGGQSPQSPSVEYDLEECFEDEATCFDGGCCKADSQTCCSVEEPGVGQVSVCCDMPNAICCPNNKGCCAEGQQCMPDGGCEDLITGVPAGDGGAVKETGLHPISALPEITCPDGMACGPFDTCCSLGYDPDWDEEIFACCPFENAVCCSEFEGCCPTSFQCDAETKDCVMDDRLLGAGENAAPDPPPIFVCELPLTQCPNGRCCESDEVCAPLPSGNYKCVERNYTSCSDGKYACPTDLFCDFDEDNDKMMCSKEVSTDNQVKEALLREYWGDDEAVVAAENNKVTSQARCAKRCAAQAAAKASSLLQVAEGQDDEEDEEDDGSHTPEVHVEQPPQTLYWYPKKLRPVSRAKRTSPTTLPTVQAGKVCQHFGSPIVVEDDMCFLSNQNGHFVAKERERVEQLVEEYKKRTCDMQKCLGTVQKPYTFVPEDLDPCPCREKPTPVDPKIEAEAGSDDSKMEAKLEKAAEQEIDVAPMKVIPANNGAGTQPSIEAEKPATLGISGQSRRDGAAEQIVHDPSFESVEEDEEEREISALGGAAALTNESQDVGSASKVVRKVRKPRPSVPRRTLVAPVADEMQLYSTFSDSSADVAGNGDKLMMLSSGKEPVLANCDDKGNEKVEDGAEEAVDLDGKAARDADALIEDEEGR